MKRPPLSPEQRQFIIITVLIFIMLIVVDHYRPNDLLIAASLAIAVYTLYFATLTLKTSRDSLELTKKSLDLTSMDIKNRVRPFVSVNKFEEGTIPGIDTWHFTLVFRNTGSVPAKNVRVKALFLNKKLAPLDSGRSDHCPLLAPGAEWLFGYVNLQENMLKSMDHEDGVILQVNTVYEGIGERYETNQTYEFNRYSPLFSKVRPTEPSSFT